MQDIIKLLTYWDEYCQSRQIPDIQRFGQWLNQKTTPLTDTKKEYGTSPDALMGFLFGSLISYAENWTRLAFRDLPLTGFTDFGMLKYIEENHNPTKKSIANHSVAEDSTIFESIKRLQKQGLIMEEADSSDKRVRRVKLSKQGKKITDQATQTVLNLSRLLAGDLEDAEKQQMIQMLRKLNHFHDDLYQHATKEQVIDTFEL